MAGKQNVPKPVSFQQVSMEVIPPEAPDREVPVVLDVGDLLRVAYLYQSRLGHLEAKIFILEGE